jgi:two-component system sensor histidine kinase UhpB
MTRKAQGKPGAMRPAFDLQAIRNDVSSQVELLRQLQHAGEQMRDWSTHLHTQIEAERARIARDIHDELGSALTAIRMELALPPVPEGSRSASYARRDAKLLRRIDAAIEATRRICSDLRPSLLDNMGLCAAIEWLCQDVQERTRIRCVAMLDGIGRELESERSIALFRIVQEAMTNVIRHAGATTLTISQKCAGTSIVITVSDDGRGIDAAARTGRKSFGLVGMQERARAFGGRVQIEGSKDGTRVTIRMPIRGRGKEAVNESVAGR